MDEKWPIGRKASFIEVVGSGSVGSGPDCTLTAERRYTGHRGFEGGDCFENYIVQRGPDGLEAWHRAASIDYIKWAAG